MRVWHRSPHIAALMVGLRLRLLRASSPFQQPRFAGLSTVFQRGAIVARCAAIVCRARSGEQARTRKARATATHVGLDRASAQIMQRNAASREARASIVRCPQRHARFGCAGRTSCAGVTPSSPWRTLCGRSGHSRVTRCGRGSRPGHMRAGVGRTSQSRAAGVFARSCGIRGEEGRVASTAL